MTVNFYSSSDAGAPALRGNTPGDFINVLTQCLVNGYGDKAGAGWSRPFIDSNVAVFKQGAGTNGMCLRVDDTSVATTNRAARVLGYETMSDVSTGSGRFPLDSQVAGGMYWYTHYGSGSPATARPWMLIADQGFFYFLVVTYPEYGAPQNDLYKECYWFGDINRYGPADGFATIIRGGTSGSESSDGSAAFSSGSMTSPNGDMYAARSFSGLGGSLSVGRLHDQTKSGYAAWGSPTSYISYPHGPDGGLLLSSVWVYEPATNNGSGGGIIRGVLPGIWAPLQNVFSDGDTFAGMGPLAGRNFLARKLGSAKAAFEVSDTWRS